MRFLNHRGPFQRMESRLFAGGVLLLEGDSILREISGEITSDRLKPGLHALWASEAYEICGLRPDRLP
jgi:hypothetical protein